MQLVIPGPSQLLLFLLLLALALGVIVVRHRDALAEVLQPAARFAQWLLLGSAGLAMVAAFTDLPVGAVLQAILRVLDRKLFQLGDVPISAITIGTGVAVVLVSWWISTLAREGITKLLLSRGIGDEGSVAAIARLLQYIVVSVGIMVGLQTIGLDLSAVFTAGAVFAVGVGLAMQKVAENFVSGVILLVERSIRPGDILELESGELVRVEYMGIRATVVRTLNDEEVILPNSMLVQNRVKNLRLSDKLLRVRVSVGVSYDSDLELAMAALQRAAEQVSSVASKPPVVLLTGFGASSVDFEVSAWTAAPWGKQRFHSALARAIWDALKEADITISFPQLDLHVDDELVQALGERSR